MILEHSSSEQLRLVLESEADTERLGRALAEEATPGIVIGLVGTLGAGKTRLVRAMAEALGVDPATIASPTFVLVHEYLGRLPIYHFDTYRLTDLESFEAIGALEYFDEGAGVCLVEWADLVADRLPRSTWWVVIELAGENRRQVTIRSPAAERLASALRDSERSSG